jgi:hypothetical protein
MGDYFTSCKVMDGCFREKRSVGKPRSRLEATVWMDTVVVLQIPDWKLAERSREWWVRRSGRAWP